MKVVDFSRSFLKFRIDLLKRPPITVTHEPPYTLNTARIQVDCRLLIVHKPSGASDEFVLGASCKTERVGVEKDVWLQPNADFAPIFSRRQFVTIKTYDRVGQTTPFYPATRGMQVDRQSGLVADGFDDVQLDLCLSEATLLSTTARVVEATLNNEPLVARTELETADYLVDLQYPIKTMNANERDGVYQTDTGPVLFPDLSRSPDEIIDGLELAYSAFNSPNWIEFIVRAPIEIADGVSVYHYWRSERCECRNQVLRLGAPREIPRPKLGADAFAKTPSSPALTNQRWQ